DGRDLVFSRRLRASGLELWRALVEPALAERWIGVWSGPPQIGATLTLSTNEADEVPVECLTFDAVTEQRPAGHLEIASEAGRGDAGSWHVQIRVAEHVGLGVLTLVHHLVRADRIEVIGPHWEHRLDRLAWIMG